MYAHAYARHTRKYIKEGDAVKVTKRLIKAIIALVASVVLCIGVCLAWFSANDRVGGKGMGNSSRGVNISEFTVTAYELTDRTVAANGTVSYSYDTAKKLMTKDSGVYMYPYGNIEDNETAALLEFKYKFDKQLGKDYGIFAQLNKDVKNENDRDVVAETAAGSDYDFVSDLSSATDFFGASVSGSTVTLSNKISAEADGKKVNLNDGKATDADTTLTFYCVIDYDENKVFQLYLQAGELGGEIWSQMRFANDIRFYMTEV